VNLRLVGGERAAEEHGRQIAGVVDVQVGEQQAPGPASTMMRAWPPIRTR
jgi:hypothetical protein